MYFLTYTLDNYLKKRPLFLFCLGRAVKVMDLHLLPTLRSVSAESPTLNMVRAQRLYSCSEEDIPQTVSPAAMRDVFELVSGDVRAFIGKGNTIFVTRKKIAVPLGLKRVPVEELLLSIDMPEVRLAVCDFILNEVLPQVAPDQPPRWSLDFLIEFDRILSIPIENAFGDVLSSYNHRTLKHRLCTRALSAADCERVAARLPQYAPILAMFQDYKDVFDGLV